MKSNIVTKILKEPRTWADSLDKRRKLRNMDMRFCRGNTRSLYRAGSLATVSKELSKYKLDLLRVQEVGWEGGDTEPEGKYTFLYRKGMKPMN
jgi:hypothetical protein